MSESQTVIVPAFRSNRIAALEETCAIVWRQVDELAAAHRRMSLKISSLELRLNQMNFRVLAARDASRDTQAEVDELRLKVEMQETSLFILQEMYENICTRVCRVESFLCSLD